MKKFQPMTPAEHLQALYVQGHDWALEVSQNLEAAEEYEREAERLGDLSQHLHALLGLAPGLLDSYALADAVEARLVEMQEKISLNDIERRRGGLDN